MQQSKFSLADVLALIAALLFSFVCFLGMNFYTLGDVSASLTTAGIIFALLFGAAFGAKLLKRTSRHFKTCFVFEAILLVFLSLFTVLFSYSPFPHYFAVSAQKDSIAAKLTASITQAENMFAAYEKYADNREQLYRNRLRSVVQGESSDPSQFTSCGFVGSINRQTQINNKMLIIHADLFPTTYSGGGTGIKDVATNWLEDAKKTTESWKPISIVAVVNEVENNSQGWLNELIGFSKKREQCEQAEDFDYSLSFANVKTDFQTLGKPTALTIVLAALAFVLMLLSWFITKRIDDTTIL